MAVELLLGYGIGVRGQQLSTLQVPIHSPTINRISRFPQNLRVIKWRENQSGFRELVFRSQPPAIEMVNACFTCEFEYPKFA
jgi:hypothetical protein